MTRGDRTLAAGLSRGPSSTYWVIVKDGGPLDVLTIDVGGQKAMPVFSFVEEAEMFIRFEAWDGLWAKEITAGELISLLLGFYSGVKMVALDPLPRVCDRGMNRLVSVSAKDFTRVVSNNRETQSAPTPTRRAGALTNQSG